MTFIPEWAESIKAPEPKFSAEEIAGVRAITDLHLLSEKVLKIICDEVYTDSSENALTRLVDQPKRETITLKGRKNGRR